MFLDMGYNWNLNHKEDLSLPVPRPGEHPVNIDMVTSVARDCVLACVECHLLSEVFNNVSAQFPTALEEVIDFRRDHIGSVDVCVREIVYRKNQMRYQQYPAMTSPQYGAYGYPAPAPPPPVPVSVPVSAPNYAGHQTNGYTPVNFNNCKYEDLKIS